VDIQRAHFALEPLSEQSVQQRAAMVTKCEPLVVVDHETVRDVHAESGALLTSLECCVIKLSQIGPVKASPHLSFLDILLKLESDTFCERRKCTLGTGSLACLTPILCLYCASKMLVYDGRLP
jgi:hypothetical protein